MVSSFSLPKQINFSNGYTMPNLYASIEDFRKLRHYDLSEMDEVTIYKEELRVKLALAAVSRDEPLLFTGPAEFNSAENWLIERLAAIREERRRRGG